MKKRRLTKSQKRNIETKKRLQKEAWQKYAEEHEKHQTRIVESAPQSEMEKEVKRTNRCEVRESLVEQKRYIGNSIEHSFIDLRIDRK